MSRTRLQSSRTTAVTVLCCTIAAMPAIADDDHGRGGWFGARLSGFEEVHFIAAPTPALRGAVSTPARGSFKAKLDRNSNMIDYELSYEGLSGDVRQAHIHFGQRHTTGGIVVWLCQTAANPAPAAVSASTPPCPPSGVVTGSIGASQVLDVAGQGIVAGEFDELVAAIRAGATYVNVHSATFGAGEIRGQLGRGHDDHGRD